MRTVISALPWLRAFAIGLLLSQPAYADCFPQASGANSAFDIVVQAPPPRTDGQANYPYYPATVFASGDVSALNLSQSALPKYWFQWANRCHDLGFNKGQCGWNPKGNFILPRLQSNGEDKRPYFSTFKAANGCTLAQAAYALNLPDRTVEDLARESGFALAQHGDPDLAERKLVDVCILPVSRLPADIEGIVLDYEVQDGRTPAETRAFLESFAELVRRAGKKPVLFTNPLDAPTQRYTGVDASNANALLWAFDRMTVLLWSGNRQKNLAESYRSQIALLKAGGTVDPKRVWVVFELKGTSLDDARMVNDLIRSEGLGGLMFWRNYATVGGSCDTEVNRKIGCAALGACQ